MSHMDWITKPNPPSEISYWQRGCNDAKAGKPLDPKQRRENGYENGFYWGQHGRAKPLSEPTFYSTDYAHWMQPTAQPDPPLKNPYMEGIELVEGILDRLQTFTKEFPSAIDKAQQEEYRGNLLEVRDTLHGFRQQEMILTDR